jgi:TolB protein
MGTISRPEGRRRTRRASRVTVALTMLLALSTLLSCGGTGGVVGPDTPGPDADDPEPAGALAVVTSTVAGGLDEDGFVVTVDGSDERTVAADDTTVVTGLTPGDHTVALTGVEGDCSLETEEALGATIAAGDTVSVVFEAVCRLRDRIVFGSNRGGTSDIWVVDADGASPPERILETPGRSEDPAVSPDGTRIVFVRAASGEDNDDLWIMEADGSHPVALTETGGAEGSPAWSPDGTRIAFQYTGLSPGPTGADTDVVVAGTDGADRDPVAASTDFDGDPAWSPDGTRLAFASTRQGNADIWVAEVDGDAEPVKLTGDDAVHRQPTWSPDGTRVAYRSGQGSTPEIHVACVNGAIPPENLTENASFDGEPAWSPGGELIAFTSKRDGGVDLHVMGADGSDPVRLTDAAGNDRDAAWSPRGASGPGPRPGPGGECQVAAP